MYVRYDFLSPMIELKPNTDIIDTLTSIQQEFYRTPTGPNPCQ